MIFGVSLRTALSGLGRLARLDASGVGVFTATRSGFWQSFRLLMIAIPAEMLFLVLQEPLSLPSDGEGAAPRIIPGSHLLWLSVIQAITVTIGWAAYPLVMAYVSEWLGAAARYYRYMVVYNWVQIALIAFQLPLIALVRVGVLPENFALLLSFAAMLVYSAFIARHGLGVHWVNAVGIVFLDVLLSWFISDFAVVLTKQAL